MELKIVDAGCGIGKTTSMINKINNDFSVQRYFYVTPFLDEVKRIKELCHREFVEPEYINQKTKLNNLETLIHQDKDIVITHSLFLNMTRQTIRLLREKKYILIIDESIKFMDEIHIASGDIEYLTKDCISINKENNRVSWLRPEYEGVFNELKNTIENKDVYLFHNQKKSKVLFWTLPYEIFFAFKEVYLLTYMFDKQLLKKYLQRGGFSFKYLYVKDFQLTEQKQIYDYSDNKNKIDVCLDEKLNQVGEDRYALSISWFQKKENQKNLKQIKNNMLNYIIHKTNTKTNQVIWTTFLNVKDKLKGKGYTKGFYPINIRGVNDLKDKDVVMYIANRFINPLNKNFLASIGILCSQEDDDNFALSELIQFVYRSAIRDDKEIKLYIPSKRMRDLFTTWQKKPND